MEKYVMVIDVSHLCNLSFSYKIQSQFCKKTLMNMYFLFESNLRSGIDLV